jgi:tRNA (guanine-N7-)-methyltransferase
LMTLDFANECARVLQLAGRLHFITDVADYFAATLQLLKETPALTAVAPASAPEAQTNFERKYRLEGRQIFRSCHEKK